MQPLWNDQGPAAWKGERHHWNVRAGCMSPELLNWLQADPVFDETSGAFAAAKFTFEATPDGANALPGRCWGLSATALPAPPYGRTYVRTYLGGGR